MCLICGSPAYECFALGSKGGQCSFQTWREDWLLNSDRHTALCKSASDWIQEHVQGNVFVLLCMFSVSLHCELIMQLKAISAVFEHLDLKKPSKPRLPFSHYIHAPEEVFLL